MTEALAKTVSSPSNWRSSFEYLSETGDWVWGYPESP